MARHLLGRIADFRASCARRQAAHTRELPGAFAVFDDALAHSRDNNPLVVEGSVDPEGLPALAEEVLGQLPYREITLLRHGLRESCAGPLLRAGYRHSVALVMLHTASDPVGGSAHDISLDDLRAPLTRQLPRLVPGIDEEAVRHLVERRVARQRSAHTVRFLGTRAADGTLAAWADLYADPHRGIAQIEDLVTAEEYLGQGYGDDVLRTALRRTLAYPTRFLLADAEDWPRSWYARRGFRVLGRTHSFTRD